MKSYYKDQTTVSLINKSIGKITKDSNHSFAHNPTFDKMHQSFSHNKGNNITNIEFDKERSGRIVHPKDSANKLIRYTHHNSAP